MRELLQIRGMRASDYQIVASELSSCSIPCRKEYDKWVAAARKLLQIPGMRASDSVQ